MTLFRVKWTTPAFLAPFRSVRTVIKNAAILRKFHRICGCHTACVKSSGYPGKFHRILRMTLFRVKWTTPAFLAQFCENFIVFRGCQTTCSQVDHPSFSGAISFNPDCNQIAAGYGGSNEIAIWNSHTGERLRTLEGHGGGIGALVFLWDGKIASGSADRSVRIWDEPSGECVSFHGGHTGQVLALARSTDGTQICSVGGRDGNVWVVEMETLRDGNARLWELGPARLCLFAGIPALIRHFRQHRVPPKTLAYISMVPQEATSPCFARFKAWQEQNTTVENLD
eukprot:g67494.t1